MKNAVYGTIVSPNTYRYIHEILNVIIKIPSTGNFYTRQITGWNEKYFSKIIILKLAV